MFFRHNKNFSLFIKYFRCAFDKPDAPALELEWEFAIVLLITSIGISKCTYSGESVVSINDVSFGSGYK